MSCLMWGSGPNWWSNSWILVSPLQRHMHNCCDLGGEGAGLEGKSLRIKWGLKSNISLLLEQERKAFNIG